MNDINKHIIKRQLIDLTVEDKETGSEVQDQVSKLYESIIIPIFDDVLSNLNLKNEIIRIDQLELDLGNLSFENLTDDLRIRLKSKFEDEIVKIVYNTRNNIAQKGVQIRKLPELPGSAQYMAPDGAVSVSAGHTAQGDFSVFEEFLKTGLTPWWCTERQKDVQKLIQAIIAKKWHEKEVNRITTLLRFKNVRHRIINTFKDEDLVVFFSKISTENRQKALSVGIEVQRFFEVVDKANLSIKFSRVKIMDFVIREIILAKSEPKIYNEVEVATKTVVDFLHENYEVSYWTKFKSAVKTSKEWKFSFCKREDFEILLMDKLMKSRPAKNLGISKRKKEQLSDSDKNTNLILNTREIESLHIGNAGLIILWPYLEIFFKELGFLDADHQFKSEIDTWRAIQLMHFISYNTEIAEESELVLNKLICNMPIEESVPLTFELSEEEKLECENLLDAVVKNWKALKGTSTEGFRQSFILREGVFSNDQSGWTLNVERRAYDLLLDKLSWPISVLKFPWNPNLIHVKW